MGRYSYTMKLGKRYLKCGAPKAENLVKCWRDILLSLGFVMLLGAFMDIMYLKRLVIAFGPEKHDSLVIERGCFATEFDVTNQACTRPLGDLVKHRKLKFLGTV
jgi:hypothetical protein